MRPVGTDPVSDTLATSGWVTKAWPTSPLPWTMLNTPGGRPASMKIPARASAVIGVSSDGLNTMVLPQASAGPDFQQAICSG